MDQITLRLTYLYRNIYEIELVALACVGGYKATDIGCRFVTRRPFPALWSRYSHAGKLASVVHIDRKG
jgi:hypothetical protein